MLPFASEDSAKFWLAAFEWSLIVSAVVLVIGIVGEWPDSDSWKGSRLYKMAKAAVIVGVVGELLADGAIFDVSASISGMEGRAIAGAAADAAKANKDAADTRERAAKIEERIAPRSLSVATITKMRLVLPTYSSKTIRVVSYALDVESAVLATQFLDALKSVDFVPLDARLAYSAVGSLALGVRVYGTDAELVSSLKSAIALSNLDVLDEPPPPPSMTVGDVMSPVAATIFVAAKPPPKT